MLPRRDDSCGGNVTRSSPPGGRPVRPVRSISSGSCAGREVFAENSVCVDFFAPAGTACSLKPNVLRLLGSKGSRPLTPEAFSMRNRGKERASPLQKRR